MTKTATKQPVRLTGFRGTAALYSLSEPLDGHSFVVVSGANVPYSGPETYIFGADENGEIVDYGELPGSFRGGIDLDEALEGAGYEVA
jgi:hypothetical protein